MRSSIILMLLAGLTMGALNDWDQARGQTATEPAAVDLPTTEPSGDLLQKKEAIAGASVESYRIVNERDEIVSVLKNGLTVIVKRVPSPVMAVRGYVHAGGVYEGKWLGGGLSHLLEHLVAGGSTINRTEAENRKLLEAIGNDSNAYTTDNHTCFYINTTPEHMKQAVDLLTGWMLGASITQPEYRREYQVVQRELEMGKGEPERQFAYLTAYNRYQISPARVPVIGYQEVIQGLSRDDVYSYYRSAYTPENMIFSLAGDVDPEEMLRSVRSFTADALPGRVFSHTLPQEPPVVAPRTVVATAAKIGQAKLSLAFPSVELSSDDLYPLDLLATILGGGESAMLTQDVRDRQQLVSEVSASDYTPDYVKGTFEIGAEVDPQKLSAATQAILADVERVKSQEVPAELLARAKTQTRTARIRGMQTAESIAASLATDYLSTGDPHFSDRYVERIDAVTAEHVRDVARRYLDPQKLLTTTMLPAEAVGAAGLPAAEALLRAAATTAPTTAPTIAQVFRSVLPDGTILLVRQVKTTPLVAIDMYALGGLTTEDEKTNGLGNLAMELLPRGTITRSASQIAEYFDSIGGDLATACGKNTWSWSASCLKGDFDRTFEVFADVVRHPAFDKNEIPAMKQRIDAGIDGQDADWTGQAFRFFAAQYFGPRHSPYQFQVIGTKRNVDSFSEQEIRDWYTKKILPARRVLAIYGDIDPDHAKEIAQRLLASTQGEKRPDIVEAAIGPETVAVPPPATQPSVNVTRVEVQKTEQPLAGIVVGYDTDSFVGDPGNAPLTVADTLTSGFAYPTGYLFTILRGRGLVYVVDAQNVPGQSRLLPGTFVVYAGCDPKNVDEVLDVILTNMARLQGTVQDIQPDWFERSRKLIVTADAMSNETPADQAATAALDELYGLGFDYHAGFAHRIEAVSLPSVQDVSRRRLRSCVITVCTPNPELIHTRIGERTYSSFPTVDLTPRGTQHAAPK